MKTFTDSAGRTWTISLTIDAAKRVKSLLGVNLLELEAGDASGGPPLLTRLGNRPNLNQMQSAAAAQISDELVKARLIEEIGKAKTLTSGASASGVRVHTLPTKPRDIEDDGLFHYAVLPPSAASDSGKPSPEAKKFLDETTGPEKPRVFRNAVLLLTASKDGLSAAEARVRDYLAWERVMNELTPKNEEEKKQKGSVDVARLQTLKINIDKARARVPEAIRQAYCIVVTVSDKDEAQAFKITVSDDAHFETIKRDSRSRIGLDQWFGHVNSPDWNRIASLTHDDSMV